MKEGTQPWTRCRRTINGKPCNRQLRDHSSDALLCPAGDGQTFLKHARKPQAANSFTAAEVTALTFLLNGLREGKDLRVFARAQSAVLTSLTRKVATMRARLARQGVAS